MLIVNNNAIKNVSDTILLFYDIIESKYILFYYTTKNGM